MKVLVVAAAVALVMPAALGCDHGHQDCAKLQIADCSGESPCPESLGGPPQRVDTSPPAAKNAQTHKKNPPAKRRPNLYR